MNLNCFKTNRNTKYSIKSIQKIIQRAAIKAGIDKEVTAHSLRHSFATHLLENEVDIRKIQELLGHASLASTQIYTKVDATTLLDTYRNAHPRERGD